MASEHATMERARLRVTVRGAVQGVGFRPFVYRLAVELGLGGWVNNSPAGVFLEAEGARVALETLLLRLEAEKPPRSSIQSLESSWLDPVGWEKFEIRPSTTGGVRSALVLPDIATCSDCLREIFDPAHRRYRYPFTNCTNCGPRFSIIEALPYDRPNTSMKRFQMCPECQAEYDNPVDRRFHAQPNACHVCGPRLELWNSQGEQLLGTAPAGNLAACRNSVEEVLRAAMDALRGGRILATKGLGGFHLMVAAGDEVAVQRLRELKHREEKPFALMFPSLAGIQSVCDVSPFEERLLRSPEAPIVLLRRRAAVESGVPLAQAIAPGNPNLGIMLPAMPLHHLLLSAFGAPVVATSGNRTDEPICTDEREALQRLAGIADVFLVHDRPIVRHVDDSVVRVMAGRELVLRRARGYAPLPITIRSSAGKPPPEAASAADPGEVVLGVGAHLKSAVCLAIGEQAFVSQHIGDLETELAYASFVRVIQDLERLYDVRPGIIAADLHPDYLSTRYAQETVAKEQSLGDSAPGPVLVQHHIAHVLACMAENELAPPVLGVSWDGTGYGPDGTVWGGEFFLVTGQAVNRVARFRQFRLPGGEQAVKEPRRSALGVLYEVLGDAAFQRMELAPLRGFSPADLVSLQAMLQRQVNSPLTSSAGRLFDAVAALAGLRQRVRFEGQAAMELEFALNGVVTDHAYPLAMTPGSAPSEPLILDWGPMVLGILENLQAGVSVGEISAAFHNSLVEAIILVARHCRQDRVVMSGGCFQNSYLTERAVTRLRQAGLRPYWHQRIPPNDGGICLGQVIAARRRRV